MRLPALSRFPSTERNYDELFSRCLMMPSRVAPRLSKHTYRWATSSLSQI
jgi:hypothetical protein